MQKTLVFTLVAVMLCACGGNKKQQEMNNISNKEKAVALLKAIETGDTVAIGYVNAANYKPRCRGRIGRLWPRPRWTRQLP